MPTTTKTMSSDVLLAQPPFGVMSPAPGLGGEERSDEPPNPGAARPVPGLEEAVERAIARRRVRCAVGGVEESLISDEVIDELLAGARTEEEILGSGGVLGRLTKRLVERAMNAELTCHVGYEPHQEPAGGAANQRNGTSVKTLVSDHGKIVIDAPRDRAGTFEPQIVKKRQRRLAGIDQKILALYSRGLSTRDIEGYMQELYGTGVSRELISRVTDQVADDVREWAKRPLETIYPVVFLDCMVLKIRDGGSVGHKALYIALGITLDGDRDVLGMWFQETEGAKFWMQALNDLKTRGVRDILICCVDGLTGFPEAIEAIFPKTTVQTCIVHMIRSSLKYVPRRDREQVARDLKPIYTAINAEQAWAALEAFDEKWGARFPIITRQWTAAWEHITPFLAFPAEVRRIIYTTNAIEALNRQLRKAIKTKGSFPNEDSARKLVYLCLQNAVPQWTRCRNWTAALLALKIHFGDRIPDAS
ncbi:IS256 family transposase [Conexibacter sp. S30A1]|jgi:putative transposase|uniref:IS256 family transposase n=1 Tax=Conexibacter sp. S30A1 TaxID=2937800 RepID=UPI00200FFDFF|nr:IS256 family transposase [Conexibacter sp. S30A1]